MTDKPDLPLAGLRVIDLAEGKAEMCGRLLADLGAEVIRIEPPGGAPSRRRPPLHDGVSLHFATHNANKLGVTLDLHDPADRERLLELVDGTDLLIETERPGTLDSAALGASSLRERNPSLVVISVTDFGQTGPYRDWVATNATQIALGGELSRSGVPGRAPVLPPGELADECTAVQAVFAGLLAYLNRLDTGRGDHVDCSVYELTAQVLDPGLGISGSARGGMKPQELGRGRPDVRHLYPIFPCSDGFVRVAVLSARQWRAMFEWLGEPAEFADPVYEAFPARRKEHARLGELMAALFRDKTMDELSSYGQSVGIPVEGLRSPAAVLRTEHFLVRKALIDTEIAPGVTGRVPSGYLEFNGERAGIRFRAPQPGEHTADIIATPRTATASQPTGIQVPRRPLEGLRVLDLGGVVVGAETGRLLADQGAEVIKVESSRAMDGVRPQTRGVLMDESFAAGNRNKLSAGVDLKTADGRAFFERLVSVSDVVLSNFKPGTLEKLGLGIDALREINPKIIAAESSALGATGPFRHRLGYGPLVRACAGITALWQDVTVDQGFSDTITVYPDHIAARVGAIGVLAGLIHRARTGRGSFFRVSQAEVALTQLSTELLRESLHPGSLRPRGNSGEFDAPQGVYPAAGDDEWVVVWVEGNEQWLGLCRVIGRPDLASDERLATAAGRVERRALIDRCVADWTSAMEPRAAMAELQAAGVPASFMQRITDYPHDPQFAARGFVRRMRHPLVAEDQPVENAPAGFINILDPPLRPAPVLGENTREIATRVAGLDEETIQRLIDAGVLEDAGVTAETRVSRR